LVSRQVSSVSKAARASSIRRARLGENGAAASTGGFRVIDVDLSPSPAAVQANAPHFAASDRTKDAAGVGQEAEPVASPATVQRRRAIEDALDCVDQRRAKASAGSKAQGKAKLDLAGHRRERAAVIIDDDEDDFSNQTPPT
jgi:hypothetical protein